ncbi:MAG: FkbM family methyltransferase [Bacteroidota bacterium]|nr:FkbM family methyltransferase [Bacteroidota bacterium]
MNSAPQKEIYRKLKKKNLTFHHVCEVGVYLPETSNIIDFIKDGLRATLVEADTVTAEKIKDYFKNYNIRLYPMAIWDFNGTIQISKAAASTFVTALQSSPAIVNDKYKVSEENTFEVPCVVFSDIDDGTIDLLSIDVEGCEWYVIKHLKSRPAIISVETHGKHYTNPFINEIKKWMEKENYIVWYKDKSDTVFVRNDVFLPGFGNKIETRLIELKLLCKKIF